MTSISSQFEALQKRQTSFAQSSAEERIAVLDRLLESLLAHKQEIRDAVQAERKIHNADIDAELLMIKTEVEFARKHLKNWMQDTPVAPSLMSLGKKSYLRHEAKGVVLNLATWNAPFAIAFVPVIGAIAAGCTAAIKPSELAPQSSAVVAKIAAAGADADIVAVVEGGPEVAQELLALPFNHVFYIGSHRVGKLVAQAAAENFASVTLEMGGKNPTIIDETVTAGPDLEEAAFKTAWGRMGNAGQMCVSPDFVLVHDSLFDRFVDFTKAALTALYNPKGEGFEKSEEFGRIINRRHFDRIKASIDDAVEKGATVVIGGETNADDCYIAPTVLTNVTDDMTITQEEIFGPVMVIEKFAARGEAVAKTKRYPKPLSSYIFAKSREAINFWLANTTSGNTVVNHNIVQSGTNPHLPFGGVNASGQGRLGGHATFLEASNTRSVVEEGPPLMDPKSLLPPYQPKYLKMIDDMLKKPVNVPQGVVNAIHKMVRVRTLFQKS